jgi:hypothetical protein
MACCRMGMTYALQSPGRARMGKGAVPKAGLFHDPRRAAALDVPDVGEAAASAQSAAALIASAISPRPQRSRAGTYP